MAVIKGTGTETDPYVVDSFTSMRSLAINSSNKDKYITFPDNTIIDCNDEFPNGYTTISGYTPTLYGIINGNNAIIRNLHIINSYGAYACFVIDAGNSPNGCMHNLKFENLWCENMNNGFIQWSSSTSKNDTLRGCSFNGTISNGSLFNGGSSITVTIDKVATNVILTMGGRLMSFNGSTTFTNSHFTLNGVDSSDIWYIATNNIFLKYCLLDGSVGNNQLFHASTDSSNSINNVADVIETETCKTGFLPTSRTGSSAITFLLNKTTAPITAATGLSSCVKKCTTEQLADVPYLQSISFPIV